MKIYILAIACCYLLGAYAAERGVYSLDELAQPGPVGPSDADNPSARSNYDSGSYGSGSSGSGSYGSGSYGSGSYDSGSYGSELSGSGSYGSGSYDSGSYGSGSSGSGSYGSGSYDSGSYGSGSSDSGSYGSGSYGSGSYGSGKPIIIHLPPAPTDEGSYGSYGSYGPYDTYGSYGPYDSYDPQVTQGPWISSTQRPQNTSNVHVTSITTNIQESFINTGSPTTTTTAPVVG